MRIWYHYGLKETKMERLIVQYAELIWVLLNLLHYYLNFLNNRLSKSLVAFDSKFKIKYDKKSFLRNLVWIGFGVVFLSFYRHAVLHKAATTEEHFVVIGGFIFLVVGYLLQDILFLGGYFVCRSEMPRMTYPFSPKVSAILVSFDLFGYSALMLLSYLVSKHPFLLGGAIGLATGGLICIYQITGKQQRDRNNQIT